MRRAAIIFALIIGAVFALYVKGSNRPSSTGTTVPVGSKTVIPESVRAHLDAMDAVELESLNWRKDGFGSVAVLSFVVANNNAASVSDVTIDCHFRGQSGTVLSNTTETIFQTFPGKKKTKVSDLNLGFINAQAAGMDCEISDLKLP